MANNNLLQIVSYNCRGFNVSKKPYIKSLLSNTAIAFLQELWLSDDQLGLLADIDTNYSYAGVSGFDCSDILSGRPYGGCAILWRSDILAKVTILTTDSRRVCAVRLCNDDIKLLVINVYMPYEGNDEMTDEFADQLAAVENLINTNLDCHTIVGGDFNVDFSRNRLHTAMLDSFCDEMTLKPIVNHENCSIDYTYNFSMTRFNILDHFLLSEVLFNTSVTSAHVLHEVDNTSDHDPILLRLKLQVDYLGFCDKVYTPCVSWDKASESDLVNYRNELSEKLKCIQLPIDALLCTNFQCSNLNHFQAVSSYAASISSACIDAAAATIPRTCNKHTSGRIPGWSEVIQPLRDKSLFWHRLWLDCDRPRTGAVADSMRRTRAAYHYAIRRVKKDEESFIRDRIANNLLNNNERNFWTEIKRIRCNKTGTNGSIDGLNDANSIARLFACKYKKLYTSVPYNNDELQDIIKDLNASLCDPSCTSDHLFSINDIKQAVSKLKPHKNEGCSELTSDHLINANDDFLCHVAFLFSAIVVHGSVPDGFLSCTIRPVPKGHNTNKSDSTNFRGIALSSLYGKILDNIIIVRYCDKLMSSELQFGFKAKHSTNMCSMVLKEAVSYYRQHQTPVFCTFLDASKAFDRLHYCKLFKLLIKRELPGSILRVLINTYTNSVVRVAWGGVTSDYFSVVNGVKQGAVLSPVLFCVYIDNLLTLLSKAGFGCYIGSVFVGALAYADDIVLLAPTPAALRKMLAICEKFADDFCIEFNSLKTKCLVFVPTCRRILNDHFKSCVFYLNNLPIEVVDSFLHLGHLFTSDLKDDADIIKVRASFVRQVNNVLCYFRKLQPYVRYKLFQSYCTSLYGCELWILNNCHIDDVCVAWRKSLRKIWYLPYCTHCNLLPLISNCLPLFDEICRRSLHFIRTCINHKSSLVRYVAHYGVFYARSLSILGQNVDFCAKRYDLAVRDVLLSPANGFINYAVKYFNSKSVNVDTSNSANFLSELLMVRDGLLELPNNIINSEELQDMIEFVCTT